MKHLIINPSDIYYLTGVRSHDTGEMLVILASDSSGTFDSKSTQNRWEEINSLSSSAASIQSSWRSDSISSQTLESQNRENLREKNILFCDPRTSALFDREKYEVVEDRKAWADAFVRWEELAVDPDFLTQTLREKIEWYGVQLIMQKSPIIQQRLLKNEQEIGLLRESQKLNKKVYDMIVPYLVPGVTEEGIARQIQIFQLQLGASGPSFPPIVAFGPNTAIPHHSPTERKLQPEDQILIDMGLIWRGYCSDMTRCLQMKKAKSKKQKAGSFDEMYELLQRVTNFIISYAKPGMHVAELDKKAREMLGKYEPYFTHSLGHWVGIDIHESPHVSGKSEDILQPWMIITIEPGVYMPGKYGARYEEMVLVAEKGMELL